MLQLDDFIYAMREAREVEVAFAAFRKHLQQMGLDMALYSLLTDFHSIGLKAGHGVVCNYPDEWMAHYFDQGYQEIDPVIKIAHQARAPFLWSDMPKMLPYTKRQTRLMNESEDAGLYDGLCVAVHGPCGEVMGMGLASSSGGVDLSPPKLAILQLMVHEFNATFMRIHIDSRRHAPIMLTPRELQVLRWLARGKTVPEITIILSVSGSLSEATVRFHVKNIYAKLEANTAAQAVAKALSLGCLTFADLNGYV